jgi:hypothetical protein
VNNMHADVLSFRERFGLFVADSPSFPESGLALWWGRKLVEEAAETAGALGVSPEDAANVAGASAARRSGGDLVEVADGVADTVCSALHVASVCGFDPAPVWAEVHRSNMDKAPGAADEVVKPAGWRPPDVAGVLRGLNSPSGAPSVRGRSSGHWTATEEAQARYLVAAMTGRTLDEVTEPLSRLLHELRYRVDERDDEGLDICVCDRCGKCCCTYKGGGGPLDDVTLPMACGHAGVTCRGCGGTVRAWTPVQRERPAPEALPFGPECFGGSDYD